ncbi:MAG TPA: TetR/AcrR family transcriptional regulator [Baekduia sp.]|nr:TetR/AcrR family transcriptional regulator [Baekduia sp.]
MATVDHRRATADRNRAAILDAAERLLAERTPLSMAAVAGAAGVSRPTLYAHFKTLADILEAAVARAVDESVDAVDAALPREGPADAALMRMLETSWSRLAGFDALARGAAEHLSAEHLHRSHAPLMQRLAALVARGQADGSFRDDLPATWLVRVFYALVHTADELARSAEATREESLALLRTTVRDLFSGR